MYRVVLLGLLALLAVAPVVSVYLRTADGTGVWVHVHCACDDDGPCIIPDEPKKLMNEMQRELGYDVDDDDDETDEIPFTDPDSICPRANFWRWKGLFKRVGREALLYGENVTGLFFEYLAHWGLVMSTYLRKSNNP